MIQTRMACMRRQRCHPPRSLSTTRSTFTFAVCVGLSLLAAFNHLELSQQQPRRTHLSRTSDVESMNVTVTVLPRQRHARNTPTLLSTQKFYGSVQHENQKTLKAKATTGNNGVHTNVDRTFESKLDRSGNYRIIPSWISPLHDHRQSTPWDITLATHASADHATDITRTSEFWQGPLSVALFIPTLAHVTTTLSLVAVFSRCPDVIAKCTLHVVVVEEIWRTPSVASTLARAPSTWTTGSTDPARTHQECLKAVAGIATNIPIGANYVGEIAYPNNLLRNVAREHTHTNWSLVVDVDMVVAPPNLFQLWQDAGRRGDLKPGRRIAYVLPAFEYRRLNPHDSTTTAHDSDLPQSREHIISMFNSTVRPFYFDPCFKCQRHSNYPEWLYGEKSKSEFTYSVPYRDPWEPFYISETAITPAYDERFRQYGFNRISQICSTWMAGFDFHVVRMGFVLHIGWKTNEHFHAKKQAEQSANRLVYRKLKEELKLQYPGSRRCNDHGYHV